MQKDSENKTLFFRGQISIQLLELIDLDLDLDLDFTTSPQSS